MNRIECSVCGSLMDVTGSDEWTCPSCGNHAVAMNNEIYFEFNDDRPTSDDWDDDSEIPEGCSACGNPDYPRCRYSCDLCDE